MTTYQVPICAQVPARGVVEVEADSFEEACTKVQADIDEHGFLSQAGEAELTTEWENVHGLSLDQANFPDRSQ